MEVVRDEAQLSAAGSTGGAPRSRFRGWGGRGSQVQMQRVGTGHRCGVRHSSRQQQAALGGHPGAGTGGQVGGEWLLCLLCFTGAGTGVDKGKG